MNHYDILLIIVIIAFCYNTYELNNLKKQKIEGFTTTNDAAINTAVKKIYLADVEAIRLLSNFAIQLSQGGTTVPGNVTFAGNVAMADNSIRLRSPNDNYHALKFDSVFGGVGLWGANGGYVGSTSDGTNIKKAFEWWSDNSLHARGKLSLDKNPLLLYAHNDTNHILRYDSAKNGVMLCGHLGGYLGSAYDGVIKKNLDWDNNGNITVNGTINCKAINITG